MKYLLSAVAASALLAGNAFAGNIEPAPVEPIIAPAPAPVVSSSPNWTGFYVGGQLGYVDVDGSGTGAGTGDGNGEGAGGSFSANGDGFIGGLTLGYDYDLGDWVIGAGADYDWTDIRLGASPSPYKLESIWRLKARAGHKIGNGLLYATAGFAQADIKHLGNENGWLIGAGYEHLVTENFSIGGELLYHEFDNFKGTGVADYDADVTTLQVRATYRF